MTGDKIYNKFVYEYYIHTFKRIFKEYNTNRTYITTSSKKLKYEKLRNQKYDTTHSAGRFEKQPQSNFIRLRGRKTKTESIRKKKKKKK